MIGGSGKCNRWLCLNFRVCVLLQSAESDQQRSLCCVLTYSHTIKMKFLSVYSRQKKLILSRVKIILVLCHED